MDTDQLLAFDRVAREGGFTRAALSLGVGQPAVSARIAALEAALGGRLFTRGRRIALTPLGEGFLPHARRALETIDDGVESARLAQGGRRARLRLGALGSLAGGLFGPALANLLRARPDVEVTLKAADHESLVDLLLDGAVDVALVSWPCPQASKARLFPLFVLREPLVLVAHPRHPVISRSRISPADLARRARPLLRLRWWPDHDTAITSLADASGTFVEVPMQTARYLVLSGAAVGFFARTYIAEDLARGAVAEVRVRGLAPPSRGAALVRRDRSAPLSPAASHLVELLRRQAKRLGLIPASHSDGAARAKR